MIAERFGWTLDYIASLPNRVFYDAVAYHNYVEEQKRKAIENARRSAGR